MMKYIMFKKSLLTCVLAISASSAFAAQVANLKIDGKVTPPTCTINGVSQGELIADLGSISPSIIPAVGNGSGNGLVFAPITVPLTVSCDAKTYLTFVTTDTYGAVNVSQSTAKHRSALVSDKNKAVSVGWTYLTLNNMKVDNNQAYFGRETGGYNGTSSPIPSPGFLAGWTTESQIDVAKNTLKLASGKVFTADISVYAFLWGRDKLIANGIDLTERVDYVGENVLTFNFGI
ncbi:fimbrial protein [Serratia fonticola]|uniref:fimbrial protein n=1 Tax=Serratia fonticola TaxID=47917 RepID=UPI0034C65F15|nr:type 1 fimbrial protein [Serratia fonticola]